MKRNIRNEVYETNSSSVHSIVVMKEGLAPNEMRLNKDGYIVVYYGFFGKNYNYYTSQQEKLSYLVTKLYYKYWDTEEVINSWQFHDLEEAIMDYVSGCSGLKIDTSNDPYIDHQSVEDEFIDYWDKDAIISFVFGKDVALKTTCD